MGNSLSHETAQRQTDTEHPRSSTLQHVADLGIPRQIKVCLMPNAATNEQTAKGESPAGHVVSSQQSALKTYRGPACAEGQQKVLLWNCNPSDTTGTSSGYTALDTAVPAHDSLQTPVTSDLSKVVLPRSSRKHAAGYVFDMHPAVSSHVAGSLPRSSSSSSVSSSYNSRGYSFDETMPHGPEHSSDDEADPTSADVPSHTPLSNASHQQATGSPNAAGLASLLSLTQQASSNQAGKLLVHPRTSLAAGRVRYGQSAACVYVQHAERIVWVLKWQQLAGGNLTTTSTPTKTAAVKATDGSMDEVLISPAFLLPCGGGHASQQQTTSEWSFVLRPAQAAPFKSSKSSSNSSVHAPTFQLGLGLRWAPLDTAAAAGAAAPVMSDRQAPGSPTATAVAHAAAHAAAAVEVHCGAKLVVMVSGRKVYSQQQGVRDSKQVFDKIGVVQDLPLTWSSNSLRSSLNSRQQRHDDRALAAAAAAAAAGDDVEVHIAVEFSAVELVCSKAAKPMSNKCSQQLQPQQNESQPPGDDTSKQLDSSSKAASGPAAARQLEAVLLSTSPRLLVIDHFFDDELCDDLMQLAEGKLVRSRVASGSETPSRTSWSHFFVKDAARQSPIVAAETQIEALFKSSAVRGPFPPLTKVEALQVVKYHLGEFYHEHYDNRADAPLTRAATIIVYLCDTEAGGATSFPRAVTGWSESSDWQLPPKVTVGAEGHGIKVFPMKGRALVFWSKRADGSEDPNSIHAADTVVKGEKWITTRWMKDN